MITYLIIMILGEGEYVIPTSTIFGLDMAEVKQLIGEGLKVRAACP